MDFAAVAEGLGVKGFRVGPESGDLEATLASAAEHPGPALVDVAIDPSGYPAQLEALRGLIAVGRALARRTVALPEDRDLVRANGDNFDRIRECFLTPRMIWKYV